MGTYEALAAQQRRESRLRVGRHDQSARVAPALDLLDDLPRQEHVFRALFIEYHRVDSIRITHGSGCVRQCKY